MINKSSRILGVIVLILGFIVLATRTQAQNIVKQGNNFVEQKDSSKSQGATKTEYTYTDSKGNVDTIYLSKNGSAFIFKVSKKTGKVYRKYLPKVTEQLKPKSKSNAQH